MDDRYLSEKLTEITPLDGLRVHVAFVDGFTGEVDLAPLFNEGELFAAWRSRDFFCGVKVRNGVPEWSDEVDLSPGALRAWCEAGRVLDIAGTDAWIAQQCDSHPAFAERQ